MDIKQTKATATTTTTTTTIETKTKKTQTQGQNQPKFIDSQNLFPLSLKILNNKR